MARNSHESELVGYLDEGTRFLSEGDPGSAQDLFLKALSLDPENLRALNCLGFIRYMQGQFAEGLEICSRTVLLYPENAYAHKGLGLHLAKFGQREEAVAAIRKALELAPRFTDAYHDLGVLYHEWGLYDQALESVRKGLAVATTADEKARLEKFVKVLERKTRRPESS
jgi:tetratricopeptide (TPR) repeat protein